MAQIHHRPFLSGSPERIWKMTDREYYYIMERFQKKINTYHSNKKEAYYEGVKACQSILKVHYERQSSSRFMSSNCSQLDESEYRYLQESFSKKLIRHCTNKEEAYNKGIFTCKSILKEIYRRIMTPLYESQEKNKDYYGRSN